VIADHHANSLLQLANARAKGAHEMAQMDRAIAAPPAFLK